ncbi:hypothetical protein A7U60_g4824 [Sanghuangporus baumii]|uniref:Uncharacterized protein n=1 Tax=Sanghuangporus baumii TaxID=108892 RepID=A0A9Q5NC03_SANBA|nr:hypothetical protein A7U60_g4824 [Sanghuangporus baumii]
MNGTTTFEHTYESVSAPVGQVQPDASTASPRKRGRQPEAIVDPKIAAKRAKAAERQRRKRERDRRNTLSALNSTSQPTPGPSVPVQPPQPPQPVEPPQLTREEEERREKVRAAARERQRKHRALVKQKKMAELGLAMGENGMMSEEVHYTLQPDGQYQPVLPPNAQPPELNDPENPYPPPGGQTGGQTFASTLLLSLSCSPLLKAHLLRSLSMTNEELCSLEPILSAAWDQWDHARRLHYAEQVAQAGRQQQQNGDQQQHSEQHQQQQPQQNGPTTANATAPPPHPFGAPPMPEQHDPNDFRSRFHRPLTAPSPFGTIPMPGAPGHIDPNLNGASTSFAEAVAKVAMAANSQQQAANGHHVDGDADAKGSSASEDAEADASAENDVKSALNEKRDS